MEMVRGRGWDRKEGEKEKENEEEGGRTLGRWRDKMVGFGKWRFIPEMGLASVEWADVLFGAYVHSFGFCYTDYLSDPDFQETTRTLLSDISLAREPPVHLTPAPPTRLFLTHPISS